MLHVFFRCGAQKELEEAAGGELCPSGARPCTWHMGNKVSHLRGYVAFTCYYGVQDFPVLLGVLLRFIALLARGPYAYRSASNMIGNVRWFSNLLDPSSDKIFDAVLVSISMKGLKAQLLIFILQSSTLSQSSKAAAAATSDEIVILREREWQSDFYQTERGKIYDKKPFKFELKEGKKYAWCACGQSKKQPFCDGTHNHQQLKIKVRPLVFKAPKTTTVWLCNCKQTSNGPFCDGTHRREDIQATIR
ncbi:unnamed protein product [Meganyctiphanes norvegica]|uniref:Iron-binding zinc finger CDGSH type domain-containing protein n=1 Tax=Meganyctiphanes norvegica TaxID=48144 RepID=A0AAV2Q642_MEGNR